MRCPRPSRLAWVAFLVTVSGMATAAIHYDDFGSGEGLSLVGDAVVSGKALRLTQARHGQSGAAWFREKQRVASGFETTFQFQLTRQGGLGHGADGFAFVVQNSGPSALGGPGSAGGFAVADSGYRNRKAKIPWSIAVFFDTFRNRSEKDPSDNYVAFCTAGKPAETRWPAKRLAFTPSLPIRLRDQQVHTARIQFQPPFLSVFLDELPTPVLRAPVDLSIVVDEQGSAWVGFTASTGGGYQDHDIISWSFASVDVSSNSSVVSSAITFATSTCLPDRNLCTPERAVVERRGMGYHVILPGNLKWGASVASQAGRTVTVKNAHGIVCRGKASESDACSGPTGAGTSAGPGFLAPDSPAGALIMMTDQGRTWFSINGRSFENNEGFYEFDLEVK